MRVRALCGRVGRAGLPGALWCASHFPLAALSFCFAWAPPGWGCTPLSRCPCRSSLPWRCALVLFLGLPLPGSSCARASFVSPAWPLAALWWFLPPSPPFLCLAVFGAPAWCLGVVSFFFFFFFPFFLCAPQLSPAFSGFRPRVPWASALCVVCFVGPPTPGSPCACPSFVLSAWLVVAPRRLLPPPLFVSRFSSLPLGAVLCCASLGAVLRRALCPPVLCCPVLCCARWVPLLVAPCPLALPAALGPCAQRRCVLRCSPVLCVFCRGAVARAVVALLCAVCVPGCCAVRSLSSPLCAVLCFAVLVRSRCAVRVVRAVAGAWCCGVPWCAAGSGGPWLSAGGVFRCRCPCLAAWSVSLWLVWFAVVPCFPVSCSVVLCCRVVLCCCALLSCCGAVGACFALLWAVVLCCAVLCCAVGWLCCFLPGGGVCVLWCSFPRAVRSLSSPLCALRCLVVLAVVPYFPVSCAVALCCHVVLCCRALLSFCGAVCVCFALLRPVVRRQCRLRCCWCLVLWRVPVRCGVSMGVLRCGGAALVCRGVLLCCALSCGVLRPVPCPAVPCCPAVLCWLAVLCGCLRCWCLFFLLSSFPLLKTPAVFPCL